MAKTLIVIVATILLFLLLCGAGNAAGTIVVGDFLRITMLGEAQFDRTVRVREDGTIPYPFIGEIPVAGMTEPELQTLLVQVFQTYINEPVILVEILEEYTIHVQVLGQVNRPGLLEMPVHLDVQSAISLAGGATDLADLGKVRLLRPVSNEAEDFDIIPVDLVSFALSGDIKSLPRLEEHDIIIVPGADPASHVVVMGAVLRPGTYLPLPGSNVLQLILQSGGWTTRANPKKVRILRRTAPGVYERELVNLEKLLSRQRVEGIPAITGGEIIVVPEKGGFFDWDNTYRMMRTLALMGTLYLLVVRLAG